MSGDHNMAQEPEGIELVAQNAVVAYFAKHKTFDVLREIMGSNELPIEKEGRIIYMIADVCRDMWKEGFTARLSGVKDDND